MFDIRVKENEIYLNVNKEYLESIKTDITRIIDIDKIHPITAYTISNRLIVLSILSKSDIELEPNKPYTINLHKDKKYDTSYNLVKMDNSKIGKGYVLEEILELV